MGRELPPADDIAVVWFGHGADLAGRLVAYRDHLADRRDPIPPADVAGDLESILQTDWDPRDDAMRPPREPVWPADHNPTGECMCRVCFGEPES